jgi:RNA recognition motif-containing protein
MCSSLQLFFGGLDLSVTEEDVNDSFSPYEETIDVMV